MEVIISSRARLANNETLSGYSNPVFCCFAASYENHFCLSALFRQAQPSRSMPQEIGPFALSSPFA
jgi:hypothetical protein